MSENNHNTLYFEASDMKSLYHKIDSWQYKHKKRLLSTSVVEEDGKVCCIALSNPVEVRLVDGRGLQQARVHMGSLLVSHG